jgi:hypothetical protein
MLPGNACVSMSSSGCLLALLTGGFSKHDLWFVGHEDGHETIIGSGWSRPALRCPRCKAVIIEGDKDSEPTAPTR